MREVGEARLASSLRTAGKERTEPSTKPARRPMAPSIYFINPAADFPTYFNAENYFARNLGRATQMADLAIPTLAALAPPDFEVRLCDENIDPVDPTWVPDYVGITGKITQ